LRGISLIGFSPQRKVEEDVPAKQFFEARPIAVVNSSDI
jgi:hypothetical protein